MHGLLPEAATKHSAVGSASDRTGQGECCEKPIDEKAEQETTEKQSAMPIAPGHGNQFMDRDEDHCTGSEGEEIGIENGRNTDGYQSDDRADGLRQSR